MNPVRIHEGLGHSRQNFFCDTLQCFYDDKWAVGSYLHFNSHLGSTQIFPGRKEKIYLRSTLKLTEFMPISCLMRSRRHLDFLNVVTSTLARHSLNARNVINWKRYFKERIFKKKLRRKNKERSCNYKN